MRMGASSHARGYSCGDDGFAKAVFDDGFELALDVPNCCVVDGELQTEPKAPQRVPKARKRKKTAPGEGET